MRFSLNPNRDLSRKGTVWNSISILMVLFVFDFCLFFVYASITFLLRKYHIIEMPHFKAGLYSGSNWRMFVKIVLVAPVLEEALFRLNLKSNSLKLAIGISVFTLMCFFLFFGGNLSDHFFLYSVYLLFISTLFYFVLKKYDSAIRRGVANNIRWIFYCSAVSFGLMHLTNYDLNNVSVPASLFYVVPQTLGGFFLGYIRMKFGFWYAYMFHGISNAITFLPSVFT